MDGVPSAAASTICISLPINRCKPWQGLLPTLLGQRGLREAGPNAESSFSINQKAFHAFIFEWLTFGVSRELCFCRGLRVNVLPQHWRVWVWDLGCQGLGPHRVLAAGQIPKLWEARDSSLGSLCVWCLFILTCKPGFRKYVSSPCLLFFAHGGFLPCLKTCSHKNIKGSKLSKSWEHGWVRQLKARSVGFGH